MCPLVHPFGSHVCILWWPGPSVHHLVAMSVSASFDNHVLRCILWWPGVCRCILWWSCVRRCIRLVAISVGARCFHVIHSHCASSILCVTHIVRFTPRCFTHHVLHSSSFTKKVLCPSCASCNNMCFIHHVHHRTRASFAIRSIYPTCASSTYASSNMRFIQHVRHPTTCFPPTLAWRAAIQLIVFTHNKQVFKNAQKTLNLLIT